MAEFMDTLIELYDPRPINNVLGSEVFRPRETVFICSPEVEQDKALRRALKTYFEYRGVDVKLTFRPVSLVDALRVEKVIREVIEAHPDCAIDISGGTDAALFAAGAASREVPVFTYSRKRNTFFEIRNAPYARNLPCPVRMDARSCFLMAGGTLLPGRGDNRTLPGRLEEIDRLFEVYTRFSRIWNRQISYIQAISSAEAGALEARGKETEKAGDRWVTANATLLRALEEAGLIWDLRMAEGSVAFHFPDETIRFWLRDIGAVLELQVFRACLAAECFDDVVISAVVNWEGGHQPAGQRDQRDRRGGGPGHPAGVHQLQDQRDPHRGAQRTGHSPGPLRGRDFPGDHRHLRPGHQKPRGHAPTGGGAEDRSGRGRRAGPGVPHPAAAVERRPKAILTQRIRAPAIQRPPCARIHLRWGSAKNARQRRECHEWASLRAVSVTQGEDCSLRSR